MVPPLKLALVAAATFGAGSTLSPLCGHVVSVARAQEAASVTQAPDTATVRLHISEMTCGGCATTARLALRKLDGVFDATVSYKDSLGVVRYDPKKTSPEQIAVQLTKLTGYPARVLPDTSKSSPQPAPH